MFRKAVLAVSLSLLISTTAQAQFLHVYFGKTPVQWTNKDWQYHETAHLKAWYKLDIDDPSQVEHLRKILANLEGGYLWMSGSNVYDHSTKKKVPVILVNSQSEFEFTASRIIGYQFIPEGVAAFVDHDQNRMVSKKVYDPHLGLAVDLHELAHIFDNDIENLRSGRIIAKPRPRFSRGFYEGGAEFIATHYHPHNRDEIRRREKRMLTVNIYTMPTWHSLKYDTDDPYVVWEMFFYFLEDEFGKGFEFRRRALKDKSVNRENLGRLLSQVLDGELGNPDTDPRKFNERFRDYWTELYQEERLSRFEVYQKTENYISRPITPYNHPEPMISFATDGKHIFAITGRKNGATIVKFPIPREEKAAPQEDNQTDKKPDNTNQPSQPKGDQRDLVINWTSWFPFKKWEYLVFQEWPNNGFDISWSLVRNQIAFWARKDRDHALYLMDSQEPDQIDQVIELSNIDQSHSPVFSPDGKKIYFSGIVKLTREIFELNLENSAITNLTNDFNYDTAPAISPDGEKIVYVSSNGSADGGFQHLFLLHLNSGQKEQLTFNRFNDSSPSWSSDGRRIFYVSDEKDRIWNLYTLDFEIDPESGAEKRVVSQWTDLFVGVNMPIAPLDHNVVYCVVERDDDEFHGSVYPNHEIFEFTLLKPIHKYDVENRHESKDVAFRPSDLVDFRLDSNQLWLKKKAPADWLFDGSNITFGTSSNPYHYRFYSGGMVRLRDMPEERQHVGFFITAGALKIYDYSYVNMQKRLYWGARASSEQLPLGYALYSVGQGYPKQDLANRSWISGSSLSFMSSYPLNRFKRLEFSLELKNQRFLNEYGYTSETVKALPDFFSSGDRQLINLFDVSSGKSLAGGLAYSVDKVVEKYSTEGPYDGYAFKVQGLVSVPAGGLLQYGAFNVHARKYTALGRSSLIAYRGDVKVCSEKCGSFDLVGGPFTWRGAPFGYSVGNQTAYGSVELRFPIFKYLVFQNNIAIGPIRGVLFFDGVATRFAGQDVKFQKGDSFGALIQFLQPPIVGMPIGVMIGFTNLDRHKKANINFFSSFNW